MSAPSNEEIAGAVETSRASVAKGEVWLTARIITALADENERLRNGFEGLDAHMRGHRDEAERLARENERLRAERETFVVELAQWSCEAEEAATDMEAEIAKLRAERAECITTLEDDKGFWDPAETTRTRRALVAKLRGQP